MRLHCSYESKNADLPRRIITALASDGSKVCMGNLRMLSVPRLEQFELLGTDAVSAEVKKQ